MIWEEKEDAICAKFEFKDFRTAFAFMAEVADIVENQNHHPNWTNIYNVVSFRLNTHDAGDIVTKKDQRLAVSISRIYSKYN